MKIKNRKRLGSGAHWVVDRVELSDEVMINGIIYKTVIIKTQKNSSADIDENIKTYSFVKKAQLPTLTFYEKDTIDEKDCIICRRFKLRKYYICITEYSKKYTGSNKIITKSVNE